MALVTPGIVCNDREPRGLLWAWVTQSTTTMRLSLSLTAVAVLPAVVVISEVSQGRIWLLE